MRLWGPVPALLMAPGILASAEFPQRMANAATAEPLAVQGAGMLGLLVYGAGKS